MTNAYSPLTDDRKEFVDFLLQGSILNFEKGQLLYFENEPAKGIFYIQEGIVKIYRRDKNNKSSIMNLVKKGNILGLHALFNEESNQHYAEAMVNTRVLFTPKETILRLLQEEPSLRVSVMQLLCNEIELIENGLNNKIQKSSRQLLLDTLMKLSEMSLESKNKHSLIDFSENDLACLTGTSETYLKKLLFEFSKNKWIERKHNKIKILHPDKLKKLSL